MVRRLRQDPLPVLLLAPGEFTLSSCAEVMATVGRMLRRGVGLVVLDRLPLERYSPEESLAVYWLLASLLGRPVAQKWDGTMVYDVRDTGKSLEYGVRRSVTNLELLFHTDAAWLDRPPELVGLLCLHPAQEGGVSRFVSLVTVHNAASAAASRAAPPPLPSLPLGPAGRACARRQQGGVAAGVRLRRAGPRVPVQRGPDPDGGRAHRHAARCRGTRSAGRHAGGPGRSGSLGGVHDRARPDPVPQQPPLRSTAARRSRTLRTPSGSAI